MLEEVLKSINSNLERIANYLEYKKGDKSISTNGTVTADNINSGELVTNTGTQKFSATHNSSMESVTMKTPVSPIEPQPAPVIATPTPVQQGTVTPVQATTVIPTSQSIEGFTREQLAVAMSNAASTGKSQIVFGALAKFNAQCLNEIKPEDYNKLATILKESGVNI